VSGTSVRHMKVASSAEIVRLLDDPPDQEVARQIRAALGADYGVETWMEQNKQLFSALRVEKKVLRSATAAPAQASAPSKKPAPAPIRHGLLALDEDLQALAKRVRPSVVTIEVTGAPGDDAATRLARAIANSPLVKTAIAGSDPNWGRILSAAGNAGVVFDPAKTDIRMQGVVVCRGGLATPFSETELKEKLDAPEVHIRFSLRGKSKGEARFWTCDLTHGYIDINASYRT